MPRLVRKCTCALRGMACALSSPQMSGRCVEEQPLGCNHCYTDQPSFLACLVVDGQAPRQNCALTDPDDMPWVQDGCERTRPRAVRIGCPPHAACRTPHHVRALGNEH